MVRIVAWADRLPEVTLKEELGNGSRSFVCTDSGTHPTSNGSVHHGHSRNRTVTGASAMSSHPYNSKHQI